MQEIYTEQTKAEIDRVLDVFRNYIDTAPLFDILWSDKVGYVYTDIYKGEHSIEVGEVRTDWIENAQKLVKLLLCDIASEELQFEIPITEASEKDCERIAHRFYPYMAQLPEYGYLVPIVFMHGWQCI